MNIATWLLIAYFAMLGNTLWGLFFPPTCGVMEAAELCVHPHIADGDRVDIFGYATPDPLDRKYYRQNMNGAELILAARGVRLTEELDVSFTVPAARYGLRRGNNSLHAHLYVFRAPKGKAKANATAVASTAQDAPLSGPAAGQELLTYINAPLTRYLPLSRRGHKKSLLGSKQQKQQQKRKRLLGGSAPAAVNDTDAGSDDLPADADADAASAEEEDDAGKGSCVLGEDGTCVADPPTETADAAADPSTADAANEAPSNLSEGSDGTAMAAGSLAADPDAAAAAEAALEAEAEAEELRLAKARTPVPHLRGKVKLITVNPQPVFRKEGFPQDLAGYIDRSTVPFDGRPHHGQVKYVPLLKLDDLGTTRASWRMLSMRQDKPDPKMNLTIAVHNIGSFSLLSQLEMSLRMIQDKMGLSEEDLDEIKQMISGTSLKWYAITTVVSVLHSFFAYMAFKNDIGFWKARTSLEGLSMRTYFSNFICSIIIFLKLLDGNTSQLILMEMGVSTFIEGWKVSKILRQRGMWGIGYLMGRGAAPHKEMSAKETESDEADAKAMRMLSYLLYPAVAGLGAWSLYYHEHRSWWSWVIQTLAHGVYLWGFIAMTPQLYINYRLKSVAHLPWRVMMYKVFNTFVDDVFAFAIEMPLSHRIACLRDDVIFFVFLYQRYLYPVDKTRPNEYGRAYEDAAKPEGEGGAAPALEGSNSAAAAPQQLTGGEGAGAAAGGGEQGSGGEDDAGAKGEVGAGSADGQALRQRKKAAAAAAAPSS